MLIGSAAAPSRGSMASNAASDVMSSSEDEVDERVVVRSAQAGQLLDPRRLPPPLPVGPVNAVNSKFVIGTKITNITVDNREKVKGKFFGLDLVSEVDRRKRAVRCGFAVCACWILLIIVGLLVYVLYAIVVIAPTRIDVELSFGAYLLELARNTSRAERYACGMITALLLVCSALGIFLACRSNGDDPANEGPKEWYIEREKWLSKTTQLQDAGSMRVPAPLVVINHSAGAACYNFKDCAAEMRYIQSDYLYIRNYTDGPYNFAVGTDGRVYEFRGWNYTGAHTKGYNTCAMGVGFLGDYRTDGRQTECTEDQKTSLYKLLDMGVALGYLRSDYVIVGHRDVQTSESPGDNLYNAMQQWPHYNKTRYSNMSCSQIV